MAACCFTAVPMPVPPGDLFDSAAPGVVQVERFGMLAGTGWAWDAHHVVTAAHVVVGGIGTGVVTRDGTNCEVADIAVNNHDDVAVIEIADCDVRPIPLALSPPDPGDYVCVLSHQVRLPYSLTCGVVSSTERRYGGAERVQIDAPINRGSSGAPVLNQQGRVAGMAVSLITPDGAWAGIGMAVPLETITDSVDALMRGLGD